jgi:hypothetical protein
MARRPRPDAPAALGVRALLMAKLSDSRTINDTFDPRWVLVPTDQWPDPMPVYVNRDRALLDDLEAGKPVDVRPGLLRGIAEVPPGCRLARVDVDGSVSPAPYERVR